MTATVRLTVISGPHKNERYCFRGKFQCEIGRSPDCDVSLSGTQRDKLISRRHCRLDIDGPCIQVHDLHSANGTFINGRPAEGCDLDRLAWLEFLKKNATTNTLEDGDMLTVGGTTLRVDVMDCAIEDECHGSAENPEDTVKPSTFPIKNCPHTC